MATTMIIKNADFSANKIETVVFDGIPCTGISLNKQTTDVFGIGSTETLVATPIPSNTTESIEWSTSDSNVATVVNGTVTAVGLGTATITVTCGLFSATCSVTVRVILNNIAEKVFPGYLDGNTASSSGNGIPTIGATPTNRGSLLLTEGTLHYYKALNDVHYYPVVMPRNTARVKFTYDNVSVVYISVVQWFNHETAASGYPAVAKLIGKTGTNDLIPVSGNSITIDIPSYDGFPVIDAISVCLRTGTGIDFTLADFEKVQVEFLPAA